MSEQRYEVKFLDGMGVERRWIIPLQGPGDKVSFMYKREAVSTARVMNLADAAARTEDREVLQAAQDCLCRAVNRLAHGTSNASGIRFCTGCGVALATRKHLSNCLWTDISTAITSINELLRKGGPT